MANNAYQKINEEKYNASGKLDLADCELTEIPSEIFEIPHVSDGVIEINLGKNRISDFSSLEKVKNLQRLFIRENELLDISSLRGLSRIEELELSANKITDISILKNFKNLKSLNLALNKIEDVGPLNNLIQLKFLDLSSNEIVDISTLHFLISQVEFSIINKPIWAFIPNLYPRAIRQFKRDLGQNGYRTLNIALNPIIHPPISVVKQGRKAYLEWFNLNDNKITIPISNEVSENSNRSTLIIEDDRAMYIRVEDRISYFGYLTHSDKITEVSIHGSLKNQLNHMNSVVRKNFIQCSRVCAININNIVNTKVSLLRNNNATIYNKEISQDDYDAKKKYILLKGNIYVPIPVDSSTYMNDLEARINNH